MSILLSYRPTSCTLLDFKNTAANSQHLWCTGIQAQRAHIFFQDSAAFFFRENNTKSKEKPKGPATECLQWLGCHTMRTKGCFRTSA